MVKTGAQNVIPDDSFGTELPVTQVDTQQLVAEKNMAKYSKTKEYEQLKTYLEARIDFFQRYLPNGDSIVNQEADEAATNWRIANTVIAEFKNVLTSYEGAQKAVEDAEGS